MKSIKDLPVDRIAVYICKIDGCKYHSQYAQNMIDHFELIHDAKLTYKQTTIVKTIEATI